MSGASAYEGATLGAGVSGAATFEGATLGAGVPKRGRGRPRRKVVDEDTEPLSQRKIRLAKLKEQKQQEEAPKKPKFSRKAAVTIPMPEFVKEHKGLVKILEQGSPAQQEKEAKKQAKELKQETSGAKPDRRKQRAEIVKKVMMEKGLKMIEASKYVKEHKLF
jgi:hypothetical protein